MTEKRTETRAAGGNLSHPANGSADLPTFATREAYLEAYGEAFAALAREHYARRDAIWAEKPRAIDPDRWAWGWTREWQAWKNRLTAEGNRYAHAKRAFDKTWDSIGWAAEDGVPHADHRG